MTVFVGNVQPVFEFILPQDCINEANQAIDRWMMEIGHNLSPSNKHCSKTNRYQYALPICQSFAVQCCKMISNLVYNTGGRCYGGLNDGTTDLEFDVRNCWGADYSSGDYVKPHNHFPADFAAVGYLKLDEGHRQLF